MPDEKAPAPARPAPAPAVPAAQPKAIRANPVGDKFHDLEDDGRRYRVHSNVGAFRPGGTGRAAMKSARDFGPGAELPRLLELGVISEVPREELDAIAAQEKKQADAAGARGEAGEAGEVPPSEQVTEVPVTQSVQAGTPREAYETGPGEPAHPLLTRGMPPTAVPTPEQAADAADAGKAGDGGKAGEDAGKAGIFGKKR